MAKSNGSSGGKVTVIGGGPGGYAAAFAAADLGLDVTLIDRDPNPGGVCLYRGCIPSKALLHVAKLLAEADEATEWGITFGKPKIDLDKLRAAKDDVIAKMTGGLGQLCKARGVRFIQGEASFLDSTHIRVNRNDGTEEELQTDYSILATGSRPTPLPGLDLQSRRIMNSTDALEIESIPKTLLIVGGGYIGLELGSVYAALGTKVSVVEMTNGLLPGCDRDLVKVLQQRVKKTIDDIRLETKVTGIKEKKGGLTVQFEDAKGAASEETYEKVLVAIGRRPNSSGLGLKYTEVDVDPQGFVVTDAQCRTHDSHIYAIGDIAGQPMLAHKASHEGRVAAEAIAGHKTAFEPNAIPAVVFTDPEVAWAGLTETEAEAKGIKIEVARFPWAASGRASTIHRPDGLTKIITEPETGVVLGVGIVGAGAGELIAEGTLAIEMGALAQDLALTIHPHPTLSETVMESAEMVFGQSTHVYRPKK